MPSDARRANASEPFKMDAAPTRVTNQPLANRVAVKVKKKAVFTVPAASAVI